MIDSKSLIGFYKKKSHHIVDLETCHIQHEINEKVVEIMRKYLDENRYKTIEVQPVDMFPHTMHVEWCVQLKKID